MPVAPVSDHVATLPEEDKATGSLKHSVAPASPAVARVAQGERVAASVTRPQGKGKGTPTTNQVFATSRGWSIKPV